MQFRMLNSSLPVVVAFGVFMFVGCGSGGDEWTAKRPKVYKASGVVKMDGKPLEGATVLYHSQSHDMSASGITDMTGKFVLTSYNAGDGAAEGLHKVVVTKRVWETQKTRYDSPEEPSVASIPKDLLPKRYSNATTTDVEVTVSSTGPNEAEISIKSK